MIFDIMIVGIYILIVVVVLKVVINAIGDYINRKGK
ncbi:hypothetical protein HWC49_gp47 [Gordonia phage Kenosha]|uniref:Uncharacterized protein n=2 Tax=Kenoshavirus TaxID=2842796 RepID=A0A649VBE8_9CAUD|nr:hypothetical protein HWC49_gp47 [Gordonia phage Kenosha]YP_009853707.1 hypothetical protein HWC79_gp48 [Gordonia phage Untouchable]QXO14652.1 hypothetical protein SEA_RUNHAAR_48 [Gordonia phage Runhaar]QZD97830.1 membrane protein [Gordonia phage Nadmeg]UVK64012.1 hypothetical protein SEA_VARDY_47 [Gordonia phage Vardy]WIC89940.1 membrane protein [Gordonia phage Hydrus]QDH85278.1 hypothetical protein SEA_KENOSHA_47 [Gordonia phage Kenosha]